MPAHLTEKLKQGGSLSTDEIENAIEALIGDVGSVESKADFLIALAHKGETPEEIAGFALQLRDRAVPLPLQDMTRSEDILDVCGTGGDRLGTYNISTAVAIVAAAAGVTVAKHGNRAITSRSGSADVLDALSIPVTLPPEEAARSLKELGFAFLFAPHYHPAFKNIAPVRKLCAERGERTIFNFLGPLLNPARPTVQLVGVPRPDLCEPVARVLQQLGIRRGMVVCGRVGDSFLDELSTLGETTVAEFYQDRGFSLTSLSPDDFPLQPAKLSDLAGGDGAYNAGIVRRLLGGEDQGPKRDILLLNAGAALFVAGKTRSILEGWELAAETIDSGRATEQLGRLSN